MACGGQNVRQQIARLFEAGKAAAAIEQRRARCNGRCGGSWCRRLVKGPGAGAAFAACHDAADGSYTPLAEALADANFQCPEGAF